MKQKSRTFVSSSLLIVFGFAAFCYLFYVCIIMCDYIIYIFFLLIHFLVVLLFFILIFIGI